MFPRNYKSKVRQRHDRVTVLYLSVSSLLVYQFAIQSSRTWAYIYINVRARTRKVRSFSSCFCPLSGNVSTQRNVTNVVAQRWRTMHCGMKKWAKKSTMADLNFNMSAHAVSSLSGRRRGADCLIMQWISLPCWDAAFSNFIRIIAGWSRSEDSSWNHASLYRNARQSGLSATSPTFGDHRRALAGGSILTFIAWRIRPTNNGTEDLEEHERSCKQDGR